MKEIILKIAATVLLIIVITLVNLLVRFVAAGDEMRKYWIAGGIICTVLSTLIWLVP